MTPRCRNIARLAIAAAAGASLLTSGGCFIFPLAGGMAESYKRGSKRWVEADYTGLAGKDIAVIVTADRSIQGELPTLIPRLTTRITSELADPARTGITGFVPPRTMLEWQYANPDWSTRPWDSIAEELEVERLIVIELYEFRLNETGNSFLWDGVATARIGVIEADGPAPGDFTYTSEVSVRYPDEEGVSQDDHNRQHIQTQLELRLSFRASWLFYRHQEPYYPTF